MTMNAGGQITMGPPISGDVGLIVKGATASGFSEGLQVQAGTTAADWAVQVQTAVGGQLFQIFGNGGVTVGNSAASSSNEGLGTINVQKGYYINGTLIAGGANATPEGTNHGMIPDDDFDEPVMIGPQSALGALTINGPFNTKGTTATIGTPAGALALKLYGDGSDNTLSLDTNGRFVTQDFSHQGGLRAQQFWDDTNQRFSFQTTIATATIVLQAGNAVTAMTLTSGGAAVISSGLSIKGATPLVTAAQTDLGITTTTTVITTAGGIAIPALASTFWVINVNGVQYGVPCFAL
jgi:hypothetical protein